MATNITQFLLELIDDQKPLDEKRLVGILRGNPFDAKESVRKEQQLVQQWVAIDDSVKGRIKENLLRALGLANLRHTASLSIAKIAAIEIPRGEWPGLIASLLSNMTQQETPATLKHAALETLGYVCVEMSHQDLAPDELNTVLTAVIQGMTLGNHAVELEPENAIAKRGRGRPPNPTIADKGMTLANNGVELEKENAIELEQDNAIAKRGRGRPQKNNLGRTGRPPANADKVCSEYYKIIEESNYLTGETIRDKWLEKLLQVIEYVCDSKDCEKDELREKCGSVSLEKETALWPAVAVTTIVALEKASHDAFSGDSEKYQKNMRQCHHSLQTNETLAKRLVELEASVILNVSANELQPCTSQTEEIERLQHQLDEKLQACTLQSERLQHQLAEKLQACTSQNEQIGRLQHQLAEKLQACAQQREQTERLQHQLAAANERLQVYPSQTEQIERLQHQLAEKLEACTSQSKQIERLQHQLAENLQARAQQSEQTERLQHQLAAANERLQVFDLIKRLIQNT